MAYKPPKVKHTVIMGTPSQSGLRFTDVKSKYKALRIPWIQRIIQGKGWNDFIVKFLKPKRYMQFILRFNCDTAYLK